MHSEKWLRWFRSLDHSECARYVFQPIEQEDLWRVCTSIHCPSCGRSTGGQGHMVREGDDLVCPYRNEEWAKRWDGEEQVSESAD